jgi:acetyl-CoA acetyltransferase
MSEAFICDFVRTPIGRYEGGLSRVRADDLAATAIKHLTRNGSIGEAVDEVFMGCANQAGEDNRNVARMALLLSGLPARPSIACAHPDWMPSRARREPSARAKSISPSQGAWSR